MLEVTFLGFILNVHRVWTDLAKVKAVIDQPPPTTITEVRSFLNAAGYMRHFIPHFATLAQPLYALTKGSPKSGTKIDFKPGYEHDF